jgi:hypothetical protein
MSTIFGSGADVVASFRVSSLQRTVGWGRSSSAEYHSGGIFIITWRFDFEIPLLFILRGSNPTKNKYEVPIIT